MRTRTPLSIRRAGLAVVAVVLFAAPLRADTVTAISDGMVSPGEFASVSLNGNQMVGLQVGAFNWNYLSGNPAFSPAFKSFCIELGVGVIANTPIEYDVKEVNSRFSNLQKDRMQELFGERYSQINTDKGAAAFQFSVWEIVNDTGSLDLQGGNFQVLLNGSYPTDPSTVALAQSWLDGLDGSGYRDGNVAIFDALGSQDQITTHLPVPPAAVLGGMGLVSLVGYGIRRRRKAAAQPQ